MNLRELTDKLNSVKTKAGAIICADENTNEEDTKHKIVLPFIYALGYSDDDLITEYRVTDSAKDRVDYVLKINGQPAIFIECKSLWSDIHDQSYTDQIMRYLDKNQDGVKIGILTNGRMFRFFFNEDDEDLAHGLSYLEFDLASFSVALNGLELTEILKLTKDNFSLDAIRANTRFLKLRAAIQSQLYPHDLWQKSGKERAKPLIKFLLKDTFKKKQEPTDEQIKAFYSAVGPLFNNHFLSLDERDTFERTIKDILISADILEPNSNLLTFNLCLRVLNDKNSPKSALICGSSSGGLITTCDRKILRKMRGYSGHGLGGRAACCSAVGAQSQL